MNDAHQELLAPVDLSIVVIGLDEGLLLDRALDAAIAAATRAPCTTEVLYVDSGSRDGSVERARRRGDGVRVIDVDRPRSGAAHARNVGLREARGTLIHFVDGDMTLEPGWLPEALAALRDDPELCGVAGRLRETGLDRNLWNATHGLDWDARTGRVAAIGGAGLWRGEVVRALHGYDETLRYGEDPDLCHRAARQGFAVARLDVLMAGHDVDLRGFRDWWSRALRVGESRSNVRARYPQAFAARAGRRRIGQLVLLGLLVALPFWPLWVASLALGLFMALVARRFVLECGNGLRASHAVAHALHTYAVKLPVWWGEMSSDLRKSRAAGAATGPLGWFAPELPSVSGTFVFREVLSLREKGVSIRTFSMHPTDVARLDETARPFVAETEVLYASRARLLRGALATALRHPIRAVTTGLVALRDGLCGRFASHGKRPKVVAWWIAGLDLAGRLERARVRHLHVHFAHAPASIAMYACRVLRIPFSVTAHANDLYVEESLLREKVQRAACFVTISEFNRRFLTERTGLPASRIGIVHCGVDTACFAFRDAERNVQGERRTLLGVGRLVPKKGFDLLLDAAAPLLEEDPRLRVVLAGDGPELGHLQERAAILGIQDQVEFAGVVDRDRILELFDESALFALPCRISPDGDRDGVPVVLMEAMAVGLPVVSTALSGVPELVLEGRTGLCVPPGDVDALRAALRGILCAPETAARHARAGRDLVEREFDLHRNAARLCAAIERGAPPPDEPNASTDPTASERGIPGNGTSRAPESREPETVHL